MQVLGAAERLHASEQRHRHLFAAPVDPKFLSAWRDFEARYEHVLAANWSTFVLGEPCCVTVARYDALRSIHGPIRLRSR
jgi:hypothetical protein